MSDEPLTAEERAANLVHETAIDCGDIPRRWAESIQVAIAHAIQSAEHAAYARGRAAGLAETAKYLASEYDERHDCDEVLTRAGEHLLKMANGDPPQS